VQLGILVDRSINAHEQAIGFQVGKVVLEIESRVPAAAMQSVRAQACALIEHHLQCSEVHRRSSGQP
jgi:hypothetical protein